MEMLTPPETLERLDALQKNINDVLVHTSKAFRGALRGAKINQSSLEHANSVVNNDLRDSYNSFNYALDDLENEINRAKAVLLRDLGELRAKRMPPLTPPPEPKPVAPPAPMEFHMDPPSFDPTSAPGPSPAQSQSFQFQGTGRPMPTKQESKPVAPVPNMGGFEFSVSPEMAKAPSPALSQAKAKSMKASPKASPKLKGAQTARPSSAPPKKEPRMTVSPQLSRTTAPTPQPAPATTPVAPTAPMNAAPLNLPPSAPPNPVPAPASALISQPEMGFTDMAFSVDDSQQMSMSSQTHQQQQDLDNMIDLTQFTDFGAADSNLMNLAGTGGPPGGINDSGNGAGGNNNSLAINNDSVSMSHVDAEIDNILNSTGPGSAEKMDMDYELGGIGLDNNSFDDMFFDNVSGGEAEFGGDSYYGV